MNGDRYAQGQMKMTERMATDFHDDPIYNVIPGRRDMTHLDDVMSNTRFLILLSVPLVLFVMWICGT